MQKMHGSALKICFTIGVAYKTFFSLSCVIIRVRVVPKRTVVGDCRFNNLSGSHLMSQVSSVCQLMVL